MEEMSFQLSLYFLYDTNERTGLGNETAKITAEMNYSDIKDAERQAVLLTDLQFQRSFLAIEVSDSCLV